MQTSKAAVIVNATVGKIASIIGYTIGILLLFSVFGIIISTSKIEVSTITFIIIMLLICVGLIMKGRQIKQRIKRFKHYVSLISAQHLTSLDRIAAACGQSVDFIRSDLQKMIDKKFFAHAVIDILSHQIIIGGGAAPTVNMPYVQQQAQYAAQPSLEAFTCSGCGASGVKPKDIPGSCEYCGSIVV